MNYNVKMNKYGHLLARVGFFKKIGWDTCLIGNITKHLSNCPNKIWLNGKSYVAIKTDNSNFIEIDIIFVIIFELV